MNPGCLKYLDPYYGYDEISEDSKFAVHEACGYITLLDKVAIVEFLKEIDSTDTHIVRGLIIPRGALLEEALHPKMDLNLEYSLNKDISLEWLDVALVSETQRKEPSIMKTSGRVMRLDSNYLVIKNPNTVRTYPLPKRKHPEDTPAFIVIPYSLISKVSVVE